MIRKVIKGSFFEKLFFGKAVNEAELGDEPMDDEPMSDISDSSKYIDLGLPSGTLWAETNDGTKDAEELGTMYTMDNLPSSLPTFEQARELLANSKCSMLEVWTNNGDYNVWEIVGPNGNKLRFREEKDNKVYSDNKEAVTVWLKPSREDCTPVMVFTKGLITFKIIHDRKVATQVRKVR